LTHACISPYGVRLVGESLEIHVAGKYEVV
jgi:hypothetical protein